MRRGAWRWTAARPAGLTSLAVLLVLLGAAIAAPLLARYAPEVMTVGAELAGPSPAHPFGTDEYGRDLLSRTLYGLRVAFLVGGLALLMGGSSGTALGLVSGFRGGATEAFVMRVVDGLLAFPALLMGIAVAAALGPGLRSVAITIAVVQLPVFARLAHGMALGQRRQDYVLAAVAIGASPARVMIQHVLRNSVPPLLVQAALAMGFSVLIEASLSFLGLGIVAPEQSLGALLAASRSTMRHAFWYPLFPGAVLTLLLFALNGFADLLNDLLSGDRRSR